MKKFTILLPTYNESGNIETLLKKVVEVLGRIKNYQNHIVVIDDYSPDGTGEIVKRLSKRYGNITLLSKKKEGLGAACIYGIKYALETLHSDIIMQMDADWSHNPNLIPQFISHIENGSDFVIGSRYIKGGAIPGNWGVERKLFSIFGNLWVRFGLGMRNPHDWSSGFRAMKGLVAEKVHRGLAKYSGYTFQIAFLFRVKKAGFKVSEIPLVFVDRVYGKSKFPAFDYIKNVTLFVITNSTLIKYLIIGIAGFSIQTVISKLLVSMGLFEGLSVAIGSLFAIVANFLGNNFWTFNSHAIVGTAQLVKKFIHFLATSIGAVIIQGVVVSLGVLFTPIPWFWLMVFAIVCLVIPYNYFIYNRFIWKTHKTKF